MKKWLALLISILICLAFSPVFLLYVWPEDEGIIDLSVTNTDLRGWSAYTNEKGIVKPLTLKNGKFTELDYSGQTFYRSRVLSEQLPDAVLSLSLVSQSASVFLDGALLYTDSPKADNRIGFLELSSPPADREDPVLISLPPDYQGKTLTIAQSSIYETQTPDLAAYPCSVSLYTPSAHRAGIISQTMQTAYPAALFAALGAGLLIPFVVQATRKRWNLSLPCLSLFFFALMVVRIVKSPFYIYYLPYFNIDFQQLGELFSITALLLFLGTQMRPPYRLPALISAYVQGLSIGVCVLTQLGYLIPYGDFYVFLIELPCHLSVLALLIVLVFAFLELTRGHMFFRLFCRTALLLAAACLLFVLLSPIYLPRLLPEVIGLLQNAVIHQVPNFPLLLLRGLLTIPALIAVITDVFSHEIQKSTELSVLKLKNELAFENIRIMQKNSNDLREWRHDLLHHLTVLKSLQRDGSTERFDSYLSHLTAELEAIPPLQYTVHPVINAILSIELSRAKEEGIQVETKVSVPGQIPIADNDLCSLLMNMLTNAREACGRMKTDSRRWMRVTLHIRGNYLYVGVENSKTGPIVMDPDTNICRTTKADEETHGYGMRAMENVVRRYHSKLRIEYTEDTFSVSSALLLPTEIKINNHRL